MDTGKFHCHSQLFSGGFFMASKLVANSTKTVTSHFVYTGQATHGETNNTCLFNELACKIFSADIMHPCIVILLASLKHFVRIVDSL